MTVSAAELAESVSRHQVSTVIVTIAGRHSVACYPTSQTWLGAAMVRTVMELHRARR